MKTKQKPETPRPETGDGRILVTRRGLAEALCVSLRTVERMLHDEEIEPVWVRGSERFHVPDVVRRLVASGSRRKNGRKAGVTGAVAGAQSPETRFPRRAE
jgi:hypothetical protein